MKARDRGICAGVVIVVVDHKTHDGLWGSNAPTFTEDPPDIRFGDMFKDGRGAYEIYATCWQTGGAHVPRSAVGDTVQSLQVIQRRDLGPLAPHPPTQPTDDVVHLLDACKALDIIGEYFCRPCGTEQEGRQKIAAAAEFQSPAAVE